MEDRENTCPVVLSQVGNLDINPTAVSTALQLYPRTTRIGVTQSGVNEFLKKVIFDQQRRNRGTDVPVILESICTFCSLSRFVL